MTELLHITERALWDEARARGVYEMSTRGRTLQEEGFIHCSLRHQLQQVAEFLYGTGAVPARAVDPSRLVVLVIDSERLIVPVRVEAPEPGAEEYPHIYGPLALDAVVAVEPWTREPRTGPAAEG